jgi:hypothetical protein
VNGKIKHDSFIQSKNEIMPFAGKWMELGIIMLGEISKFQKDK